MIYISKLKPFHFKSSVAVCEGIIKKETVIVQILVHLAVHKVTKQTMVSVCTKWNVCVLEHTHIQFGQKQIFVIMTQTSKNHKRY